MARVTFVTLSTRTLRVSVIQPTFKMALVLIVNDSIMGRGWPGSMAVTIRSVLDLVDSLTRL